MTQSMKSEGFLPKTKQKQNHLIIPFNPFIYLSVFSNHKKEIMSLTGFVIN